MIEFLNTQLELLSLVVGAVLALLGALLAALSPIVATKLQTKAKKAEVSQSKLEELVEESYKVWKWQKKLASSGWTVEPFPVEKMHTIAAIYWSKHPELDHLIVKLSLAADDYYEYWVKHRGKGRVSKNQSRWKELDTRLHFAQLAIVDKARNLAEN